MRWLKGGRESHPEVWEGLGGPPGGLGGVVRLFWRAGRGSEGRERLRVSPGGTGGVGWPSWRLGGVGSPSRRSRRRWEAIREDRGVRRPSQRAGRSRVALPEGTGGDGRSSRRAGRGQESLPVCRESIPECREGSGGLPTGPGGVGRKLTEIPWTHGNLTDVHV